MKRRPSAIYRKVVAAMLTIIFVADVVPFLILNWTYRNSTVDSMRVQIADTIRTNIQFFEKHDLPLSELSELHGDGIAAVTVQNSPGGLRLDAEQLEQLQQPLNVVFAKYQEQDNLVAAVCTYEGSYIIWQIELSGLFRGIHQTGVLLLAVFAVLVTAVTLYVGQRMTKPVRLLDEATQKVAAGDFSIQLKNEYRDELGSLIQSFNTMTRELRSVEMLRSDFISDISHEFKTPLTSIEGYVRLLRDEEEEEARAEYIQVITEETHRLSVLAQNILILNRIEQGNIPQQAERVQVDEQIRRVLTLCEPSWSKKNIELELELDEAQAQGFGALLMQVWTNLIDNAIKFSPVGGKIEITLRHASGRLVFTVRDEGLGIQTEDLGHVFDKFYKGDKSRGSDGNGLGLSIVKRVVEMHDGTIEVQSEPGRGACFTVTL